MTNRVATITRAALLGCLASCASNPSFAAPDAAAASTECLAKPQGTAPQGQRWYYRVERNTKRHCWYTRASTSRNVAMLTPSAPQPVDASDSDVPDVPRQAVPLQPGVANARAELVRPPEPTAPAASVTAQTVAPPAVVVAQAADPSGPTLADRWSDTTDSRQADPALSKALAQPAPRAAVAQATNPENTPLWVLLSVIAGVLAVVGIVMALIKTFAGSARYTRSRARQTASRWQTDHGDTEPRMTVVDDAPVMQMDVPPMNWIRIARETAQHLDDEIEHLLSRSARNAT